MHPKVTDHSTKPTTGQSQAFARHHVSTKGRKSGTVRKVFCRTPIRGCRPSSDPCMSTMLAKSRRGPAKAQVPCCGDGREVGVAPVQHVVLRAKAGLLKSLADEFTFASVQAPNARQRPAYARPSICPACPCKAGHSPTLVCLGSLP